LPLSLHKYPFCSVSCRMRMNYWSDETDSANRSVAPARVGFADLSFLLDLLSDPDVMRFWPNPLTKEECNDWLQRQRVRYEEHGYGYWLAINKAGGEPLGQAGLLQIEVDHRSETALGYIIRKAYWNRGYATEAAAGCLEYAFETLK